MGKRRVLCVGFSVTEMVNSYVNRAAELCAHEGIDYDFHKCGIGGIGIETLAFLIDGILDMHAAFDAIVFEIATGSGRAEFFEKRTGPNDLAMARCVQQICDAALRRGKSIGFLNFPRNDVDCPSDPLDLVILGVGQIRHVPVRSLFWHLFDQGIPLDTLLYDGVHVNPAGAEYYARSLIALVDGGLSTGAGHILPTSSHVAAPFPTGPDGPLPPFARHGYSAPLVRALPGQSLGWTTDKPVTFHGVTFISGPSSGRFRILVDGSLVATPQSYDKYCYYERFNASFFTPVPGRSLTVEPLEEVPDTPLLKGEPNRDARVMQFAHVLHTV